MVAQIAPETGHSKVIVFCERHTMLAELNTGQRRLSDVINELLSPSRVERLQPFNLRAYLDPKRHTVRSEPLDGAQSIVRSRLLSLIFPIIEKRDRPLQKPFFDCALGRVR